MAERMSGPQPLTPAPLAFSRPLAPKVGGTGAAEAGKGAGSGVEGLIIVILISILAWAPLLYPGFIQTHSGLGAIYDALAAGAPFSGWLPAYGTAGDGPLATWLLLMAQAVVGPLAALKLLYVASFILAGVGMFLLARRCWGELPALVAAAVYMFIPYRLVIVYVRGALAESLFLALVPFLFFAVAGSARGRNLLVVGALTLLLAVTHPGLAILAAVVALMWSTTSADVAYCRVCDVCRRRTPQALSAVIGLLAGLAILLPTGGRFLANMPGWDEHFVHFYQLFSPVWGFGESGPGWQDGMSFQLGLAPVAFAIVALWAAYESSDRAYRRAVLSLLCLAAVPIILALTVAAPLWRVIPLSALAAYPWQLLGLAALPLSLLAGAAAYGLCHAERTGAALSGNTLDLHQPPVGLASCPPPIQGDRSVERSPSLTMIAVLLAAAVLGSYAYLAPRFMNAADVPDLGHPPLAQLGDDILLLDGRWDDAVRAGSDLKLTLIWQALRRPTADYTIFVHLLDAQGVQRGQQDLRPHLGDKPTNTWLRGEVVRDEVAVPVQAGAPPGQYRLKAGMYLLATMERLPVAGTPDNAIDLGTLTVQ